MKTIPKLNKRVVYLCLMAATAIAIPAAILPMTGLKEERKKPEQLKPVQAVVPAKDAFAISGTDKFPASYDELKKFADYNSHSVSSKESSISNLEQGFELLSKLDENQPKEEKLDSRLQQYTEKPEDPWEQALKESNKRQAFAHYESKASSIMFNVNKGKIVKGDNHQDPMLRLLEKNIDMANDFMGQSHTKHPSMLIPVKGQQNIGQITTPPTFTLSEGTLIPAVIISEIDTELPGPVLARTTQNIWDSKTGKYLLIPQNSTLIGQYNSRVSRGQSRAQIIWQRVTFPNQQSINLGEMLGLDNQGVSGAEGTVNNHYDKVAVGLLMSTVITAGAKLSQGQYSQDGASMKKNVSDSLAKSASSLSNKITDKMLDIAPSIKVPMGKKVNVFVNQDLFLIPYEG